MAAVCGRRTSSAIFLTVCLAFTPGSIQAGSPPLTDKEKAILLIARHVLNMIGTERLVKLVDSREIKTESYWQTFFKSAGQPALFPEIKDDLMAAIRNVSFIDGQPAKPDVFAKAVVLGLGPLPLVPVNQLSPSEQKKINDFVEGPLLWFQQAAYHQSPELAQAKEAVVKYVHQRFESKAVAQAFEKLIHLAFSLRGFEENAELMSAKDKMNEWLHIHGIHLVLDSAELAKGRVYLKCYLVLDKLQYDIAGTPFAIYEVRPTVKEDVNMALGHAETEQGFLFLFGDQVDQEVDMAVGFLNEAASGYLWVTNQEGWLESVGNIPESTVSSIEAAVRKQVREENKRTPEKPAYRKLLIDSIAHHEGFHKRIEPFLEASFRRWKINAQEKAKLHEKGAYLYQLEASDPAFTHMLLLMITSTALNSYSPVISNMDGAREALMDLQVQLPQLRFWDKEQKKFLVSGLPSIFSLPAQQIKQAAGQARWLFEAELRGQ